MNAKHLLKIFLTIALLVMVTGCGGETTPEPPAEVASDAPAEAPVEAEAPAAGFTPSSKCIVPDVVGLDIAVAESNLAGPGLQPVKDFRHDESVAENAIISQEPAAGTTLEPCQGDVVIVVSLGAVPVPTETPGPTETPLPPPTATSEPTLTPSATPWPSLMSENEVVSQDGISLKIIDKSYNGTYMQGCGSFSNIATYIFELTNGTGEEIVLRYDLEKFHLFDNLGREYELVEHTCFHGPYFYSGTFKADGVRKFAVAFGGKQQIGLEIEHFVIWVDEISRIQNVGWKIEVPN